MKQLILAISMALTLTGSAYAPVYAASPVHAPQTTSQAYLSLAKSLQRDGRIQDAEKIYMLALNESHHDSHMPDVLVDVAEFYSGQDQMKKARLYLQRAINLKERALGEDHIDVALLQHRIGQTYLGDKNYQQSEWHLSRALHTMISLDSGREGQNLKKLNLHIAHCMTDLAMCVRKSGSASELETLMTTAGRIEANPTKHHF